MNVLIIMIIIIIIINHISNIPHCNELEHVIIVDMNQYYHLCSLPFREYIQTG